MKHELSSAMIKGTRFFEDEVCGLM
ncbi:hypothetical protein SAL_2312, partial [Streptococcus agalactiae 515]